MIYLEKGQQLFDNPGMIVYDSTGYYNDGDPVVCSSVGVPDEPACRYEAKFIKYGSIVYSISDPDELMEQIIKLDPNTLIGKDTKQIALEKMVEKIVPQSTDIVDNINKDSVVNKLDNNTATSTPSTNTSTTTPTTIQEVITNPSPTPTSELNLPIETSTTTPSFSTSTTTPSIETPTSTSTPPVDISTSTLPTIDVSTTTPSEIKEIIENIVNTDNGSTTTSIIEEIIDNTSTSTSQ